MFCSSTFLPSLLWWNKLFLVYIVLNPRCLPAVAMSTNSLELQISANEASKLSRYLVPLFIIELINSKCTPQTNSRNMSFFLHDIIEWLRALIERKICQTWVEMFQLSTTHISSTLCQNRWVQPEKKNAFFVEINLFMTWVRAKCILLHCTGLLPKLQIRHNCWQNVYAKSNRR